MKKLVGPSVAVLAAFVAVLAVVAATTILDPFTQDELDTAWEADRQFPSGGVTSVNAFGRVNVARIGIDSGETQPGDFQRTEGVKTAVPTDFGEGVQVDLYLDPDWQGKAVRAGLWVVGDSGSGGRDNLFAIIEFVNNEPCPLDDCSNQGNITDHEGWRIWDSVNGWTNVGAAFTYGTWVTLAIELDADAEQYRYDINGAEVGTGPGGQHFIREVFLNSYNYGLDEFPTLSSGSYAAHWHHSGFPDVGISAVGPSTFALCVDRYTSKVTSPANGHCGPRQFELTTPSDDPLAFCINRYTGAVRYANGRPCTARHRTHIVPDHGDLLTCVNRYTGANRWAPSHARCTVNERPNTIPAGF